MKKIFRKAILIVLFMFGASQVMAIPPTPTQNPTNDGSHISSINRTESVSPIGTGTWLIMFLGCAVIARHVIKNYKENQRKQID